MPCSIHLQNAYVGYLWLKNQYPNGLLPASFSGEHRSHNNFWRKKLIELGWIVQVRGKYCLRTYQFVWRALGVKKVRRRKERKKNEFWTVFSYIQLDPDFKTFSRKKFKINILRSIREHLTEVKKTQIAFRLASRTFASPSQQRKYLSLIRKSRKPEFSSRAAAKMFGYKSESSGLKLLRKHFKVIRKSTVTVYLNHHNLPFFRNSCSVISLV